MPTPTKSGYVPVNGGKVYYATYGSGAPLVLLHGGLMTIESFGPVIPALAETREVIAIEAQGHGRTGPLDRPMSFENMAADVAEVIRALGYDTVDVVGNSMGGTTGLRLALDHPELVKRLVIASAPYAFSGWHDYNQQGMRSMNAGLAGMMKGTPLYEGFAAVNPDPEVNFPKLLDQMAYMGKDYDLSAEIPNLTVPTQLVYGDWDAVRTGHAAKFFELLGGGLQDAMWDGSGMNHNRLAILPGVTHYTMMNSPRLAETALAFLDQE
ncbi:alpha/beta hydrolase [Devosia sp. ZB163]|uniref:alpha/beta fold hydrolase n=1 Tax=Devosia sp. ZB163 TaxID=3025938 RepID=UPI0023630E9C|nr:alpha/beta hydrolase [Devosia sp. ZB163]MDC9823385.1 alpha/beta hydrolase [Devosia sp. ZB163]